MLPAELIKNIRKLEIRTNRMVDEIIGGAYHSVFKGRGIEFDEVREYTPEDDVRDIDWNVTARMGTPFIKKYVEENEIMRPDDFVVKSIVNKSANKVFIIQSIDRKLPLEDIAEAKGLDMEELMTEIEAIVYSGTQLNLDYYLEQTLDEDVIEDIYEYFKEDAESDSLEAAMEELGSDYDEMEVRLVRVKFLCEVAN